MLGTPGESDFLQFVETLLVQAFIRLYNLGSTIIVLFFKAFELNTLSFNPRAELRVFCVSLWNEAMLREKIKM